MSILNGVIILETPKNNEEDCGCIYKQTLKNGEWADISPKQNVKDVRKLILEWINQPKPKKIIHENCDFRDYGVTCPREYGVYCHKNETFLDFIDCGGCDEYINDMVEENTE